MKIVLENKGIKTDSFYVPPFDLYEGEVAVLYLWNGGYYYDNEVFIKDIFCGITEKKNVIVHKKMTFVEHFKETKNIIFDMAGVGPKGAELIFKTVKEAVKNGGSAILLDGFDDMKQHASKCVELEWDFDNLPPLKEFKLKLK